MKKINISLYLFIGLFFGCTTEALQSDLSKKDNILEIRGKKFVPFKGSVSAVTTYEQGAEGRCAAFDPLFVTIGYEGTGNVTHLGKVKINGSQCGDPASSFFSDDKFTMITSNKDEAYFIGEGTIIPTDNPLVFSIEENYSITGGTGRLRNLEGHGKIGGQVVFTHFPPEPGDPPIIVINIFDGVIAY